MGRGDGTMVEADAAAAVGLVAAVSSCWSEPPRFMVMVTEAPANSCAIMASENSSVVLMNLPPSWWV